MKKLLLLLCICTVVSLGAFSQVYLADTAFTTDVGYGGAPADCVPPHMAAFGWYFGRTQGYWLADAFTVPVDSTWIIDTVIVYGIQTNSGTTSTFSTCNLQIYNGIPGSGGSVMWGDTVTNVLAGTGFTGIYRVDTISSIGGLLDTSFPIMYLKLHLSPALILAGGTYWLSWSGTCVGSSHIPHSPAKVLPGRINPPGQIGREYSGGAWYNVADSGNAVGFNKIIKGSATISAVPVVNNQLSVSLRQNTPNPFSRLTTISFYMPQPGYAKLSVYNTIGQLVATLLDGAAVAGEQHVTFNGDDLPAGIYYYQLSTNSGVESNQMLLVR